MQLRCNHRHKRITWIILILSHLNLTFALASVKIYSSINQPSASSAAITPSKLRHASFRNHFSPSIADYFSSSSSVYPSDEPSLITISETSSKDEVRSGTDVEYLPTTRHIRPTSTSTLLDDKEEESLSAPLNRLSDASPPTQNDEEEEYQEQPSEVLYGIQSSQSSDIEPTTTTTTTAFQLFYHNDTAYSDQTLAINPIFEDLSISEPTGTNLILEAATTTDLNFETTGSDFNSDARRTDIISKRTRNIPMSRTSAIPDTIRTIPMFSGTTRTNFIFQAATRTNLISESNENDLNSEASRTDQLTKIRTRTISISGTDAISDTIRTISISGITRIDATRTIPVLDVSGTEEKIRSVLIFEPSRTMLSSEITTGNIPVSGISRSDVTSDTNLIYRPIRTNLNSEITSTVSIFARTSTVVNIETAGTDLLLFEPSKTNLISETAGTVPTVENTRTNLSSEISSADSHSERNSSGTESTVTDLNFETTTRISDPILETTRTKLISPFRTSQVTSFDSTMSVQSSSSIDSDDYGTSPLILNDEEFLFDDSNNSTRELSENLESSYTAGTESSYFILLPSASFPGDTSELLSLKSTVVLESSVSSFLNENPEKESRSSLSESPKIVSSPTFVVSRISPSSTAYFTLTTLVTTITNNNNNVNFGRDLSTKIPENVIIYAEDQANKTEEEMKESPVVVEVVRHQPLHPELPNEDPGLEHKPYLNNTVDKRFDPDRKEIDSQSDPRSTKNDSNDSKTISATLSFRTSSVTEFKSTVFVTFPSFVVSESSIFTRIDEDYSSDWLSSIVPTVSTVHYLNGNASEESRGDFTILSPSRTIITEEPIITKFTTLESHNEDKTESIHPSEKQTIMPTVLIPTAYLSVSIRASWAHLCAHQFQYQKLFAKHLGAAAKASISETQIVFFNINECNQVSLNAEPDVEQDVSETKYLYVYVRDRRGTFSKTLTQLLGNIILKLKEYGELKDVVVGVQLHHKGDHGEQHQPQASDTHSRDMGIVAAITISCIAGVCLMLLGVLLLVLKRRHGVQQQRRCRPVTDAYSLESISIYSSFRKRKMRASKRSYLNQGFDDPSAPSNRLNFAHLAQYTTDENAITEEYKQIPMTMAKLGEMPSGADVKNRYANVIPFPETRVLLTPNPEVNSSDYINANYVRGFQGKPKYYIACQAPLDITIVDFWQMIWENQCKVILMLTNWDDNGVPKCAQYFSESNTLDNHRLFGDYQITTKKVDVREFYTITYLQLKNLDKNLMRDVVHYWYTAWPAQGVPTEKVSILEMLLEARASIKSNQGPTVVHCSPGTGRTGTVLAIDICAQEFETKRTVDVPRCVYHLRRDRGGLVQTTEQYLFIYEVLNEFACRVMNQSGRSSVRSSR